MKTTIKISPPAAFVKETAERLIKSETATEAEKQAAAARDKQRALDYMNSRGMHSFAYQRIIEDAIAYARNAAVTESVEAELAAVRKSAGVEGASGIVEQAIEEILKPEGPTRRQYLEEHDYQKAVRRHAYRIDKATSVILSKLAAAKSTPGVADEMLEWLLKKDAHLTTDQGCGDGPSEWGVSVPYGNRNDMSFRSYTGSTPRDAIARAMEGEKLRAVKQEQIGGAT